MEYALIERVTDIVKQDSEICLSKSKEIFCEKMNSLFRISDITAISSDISKFISVIQTSTSMQAIIPPEIMDGLKKGIYKFSQSDGEFLAQIRNVKNGQLVKNLRLKEVRQLSNPAGLNDFSFQMATQMKLAEIQNLIEELSVQMNRKLDSIIQNQVDSIISEAETCLLQFEDYKKSPELGIEIKDLKFNVDESIQRLKKDITNRIITVKEIDSRKSHWFKKTVKPKDIEDAAKNVSYIQEESQYLQVLYMIKAYITKSQSVITEYSDYLNTVFSKEVYYMLNTWEFRPQLEENQVQHYFWVENFPKYLDQIKSKSEDLLLIGDDK